MKALRNCFIWLSVNRACIIRSANKYTDFFLKKLQQKGLHENKKLLILNVHDSTKRDESFKSLFLNIGNKSVETFLKTDEIYKQQHEETTVH